MQKSRGLFLHCLHNLWVPLSDVEHADSASKVEIPATSESQIHAPSPLTAIVGWCC